MNTRHTNSFFHYTLVGVILLAGGAVLSLHLFMYMFGHSQAHGRTPMGCEKNEMHSPGHEDEDETMHPCEGQH